MSVPYTFIDTSRIYKELKLDSTSVDKIARGRHKHR